MKLELSSPRKTDDTWHEVTLGEVAHLNEETYSPKEAWPFVNYLDTGSITENRIAEIQKLENGKNKIPSRARRKVQPGDIVYSTVRPNQRHFGLLKGIPENFLASTGFAVLRGKEAITDTGFLYWFLVQDHIIEYLHSIAENSTSAYPSIRPSELERLTLALPPLLEQRAIAHILGTLDDKIDLNRRMNQTLEEMARAIFQDWFVDFGPTRAKMEGLDPYLPPELWDLFPDELVDSELGEIPEGWEVKTLGDVVSIEKDSVNPSKSPSTLFSHFSIPAYDQGYIPKPEFGEEIKSTKSRVVPNAVLLSKLNPEIERVWLVDVKADEDAVCSTEFLVLKTKQPFNRAYIYCHTRTEGFRLRLQTLVTGTSKSHQRAQPGAILGLPAIVPSAHCVKAFDQQAEGLLATSVALRRESLTLSMQRDALLPKLVSGEVRVD